MSIDWITVAAQIANFLVLVWLLKRFLYRPILDGIDAREAEIMERMEEAVDAKTQAQTATDHYKGKVQALDEAQAGMSDAIRKAAEEQRDILLAEAQQRNEEEHALWREQLDNEAQKYTTSLHRAGAAALLALTRKVVLDLSGDTLEQQMAHHLLQQIKPMMSDLKQAAGNPVQAVVTSHDPLPRATQDELSSGLRVVFPNIAMRFDTDEEQAPGLTLQVGGAQLVWSVDTYIDGLNALVHEELERSDGR